MDHYEIALLKQCIETRAPILLLGAGFSTGAKNALGNNLMLGKELSKTLYDNVLTPNLDKLSENDKEEAEFYTRKAKLRGLCTIIRNNHLIKVRNTLLQRYYSVVSFDDAPYYQYLTDRKWSYIFSLNIDNLVECIYKSSDRPLKKWTFSSPHYKEEPNNTLLIKLHGDVKDPNTYVFDDSEYLQFSASDCWMLRKFSDLYVCHDVIIIGTQFQEADIEIALQNVFQYGINNEDFHYFFISPGSFQSSLEDKIKAHKNFHHICWTTEEFLTFLHKKITQPQDALHSLRSQGISYWNQELEHASQSRKDWELYYGRPSEPKDFYYNLDIERKEELSIISKFVEKNPFGLIEVVGKTYIGKTCLVKRALSEAVKKLYKAFYCPRLDINVLMSIKQYLSGLSEGESVILCFDNCIGFQHNLDDMIKQFKSKLEHLIVIITSNDMTTAASPRYYNGLPFHRIEMTEKINRQFSEAIYDKLKEQSQLGKLLNYADKPKYIKNYICDLNDIIDVLYVAHTGRQFSDYFRSWLNEKRGVISFPVFQAITLLAAMGYPFVSISQMPEIAEAAGCVQFKHRGFLNEFREFCFVDNSAVFLRCSRLFQDVALKDMEPEAKKSFFISLAEKTAANLDEKDRNERNELFKHITRASSLVRIVGLQEEEALDTLLFLRENCKHLSYYWIQLGILYRERKQFEDAQNAFEYAREAHGCENYQISHAFAKNYMEWGYWELNNNGTDASHIFDEGSKMMLELIWKWSRPDAICFSSHAYIDMNIKYYSLLKCAPSKGTWDTMNKLLEKFKDNAKNGDHYLTTVFDRLLQFAAEYNLSTDYIDSIRTEILGMRGDRAGKVNLGQEEIELDMLPSYD